LVLLPLLAGCTHYDVTMSNGSTFRTASRPKLDDTGGYYVVKNRAGEQQYISVGRVRRIEAVRAGSAPSKEFFY
jgi:hypothetical protein